MSELFKSCPDTVSVSPCKNGIVFRWSRKGIGFGELTLSAQNGKLYVDSEAMTDEFCLSVIKQAFDERETPMTEPTNKSAHAFEALVSRLYWCVEYGSMKEVESLLSQRDLDTRQAAYRECAHKLMTEFPKPPEGADWSYAPEISECMARFLKDAANNLK